jgi:beta-1,4-mannosyl-glycoprotein beta-1,4-N-acetylglucosaminyltransferase
MENKIYDCFLFSHELELLELRLKILDPYVDYFVLIESPYSFSGVEKELTFRKNRHLFNKYKIIHLIAKTLPEINKPNSLRSPYRKGKRNEFFARDYLLKGLKGANEDDIIVMSDLDEIPNPKTLLKNLYLLDHENLLGDKRYHHFSLRMNMFYYYMNCLSNESWSGSVVCKLKNFKRPSRIRKERGGNTVENGGWHYSYMGGVEGIQKKISRIGSVQLNQDRFTNSKHLEECMKKGSDLYGRRKKKFKFINALDYGPKELKEFLNKYPKFVSER